MKFFIVTFALVAAAFAAPQYEGPTKEGLARIISQTNDQTPTGEWQSTYETENGISASEAGNVAGAQGVYRYTAPDGQVIERRWSASEDGFKVEAADLPVPPPIPEEILRSLEWNAAHPEEEKQWDPENYKPGQPAYPYVQA